MKWSKAIFLGAAWALSACTKAAPEKYVVVALSAPPSTLDPLHATDATGERITGLLYSAFTRLNKDLRPTLDAAETLEQRSPTKYVFKLKHLTFSDGTPVTARDVDANFAAYVAPTSPFKTSFSQVKSFHTTDDLITTIELTEPSATFLTDLREIKIRKGDLGSGPFILESQTANDIRLKARKDHPYAAPHVEGVDFKIVRDDNTRVLKMMKGELDLAQAEFPPMKIAQLKTSPKLKVYEYPGLAMTYLLVNLKDPALSKLATRQVIAHDINVDEIIKYKLDGLATRATSLVTPINPFFDRDLAPIKYAPTKTSVQEELTLKVSSAPAAIDNARIIANDLQKAGFKIKVQAYEWGTFYGDVQAGRFQLATLRWVGTIDPDLYRKACHSKETPPTGRNRGSYTNAQVDALTEQGIRTIDFNQRKSIYSKVQKQVFEDLPFIPLWYDTEVAVVSKRLKNYEPPTDGSFWILTKVEKK